MLKSKLILFFSLTILSCGLCQTGPGGVGTNDGTSSLKIWYRPEFGISTSGVNVDSWANSAGVAAHDLTSSGTNRPQLVSGAVNGSDELDFDGNDYLEITGALSTTNFVTDQASSFVVTERSATTSSWVYATSPHTSNRFSCHISWSNGAVYFDIGTCCGNAARIQVNSLTGLNSYSYWSYDALSSTGKQLYRNGALLQNRSNSSTYSSHASHSFRIGEIFNGNITEVIIYRQKVNTAQRFIIENYLSAKYNITPAGNDIYDEDDAANGNYDFDVAGIGRVDASNLHDDAQGTGIVRMLNPGNLGDNEYLIWGHDNGGLEATEIADVPGTMQARFDRVWRVSEVDASGSAVNVGSVDMRWDLTGLGSITTSDLRLLIDTDNDGIFSDETPISGATSLGGNVYEFTAVSGLTDNLRFTLGTINSNQTPLPIKLVYFNAVPVENETVNLTWQTASEVNNDFFTVEHSQNGEDWEKVIRVEGAGNTAKQQNYSAIDYEPYQGVSYYRLKQTDFNGDFTTSNIVSVFIEDEALLTLFPNPNSDGRIMLSGVGVSYRRNKNL